MIVRNSIAPSLPASLYGEIEALFTTLKGVATEIQIDLVDGSFAPYTSWPFTEEEPLAALAQLSRWSADFDIEIDCMICNPERYVDTICALGAQRMLVHAGSTDQYTQIFTALRRADVRPGLAITNDTPLSLVSTYRDQIDYVQVMGIAEIGQQGQPFDERTIDRVRDLRAIYPDLEIAVDGAVNQDTIPRLLEAGANRFAPGSAVAKATNPAAAYKQLSLLAGLSSEVY